MQTISLPPVHVPVWQVSDVVHESPSSQPVPLLALGFEHVPLPASQTPAWWHWSLALQTTGVPPTQLPPLHTSTVVHGLLSLQLVVLSECVQPVSGSQPSLVHKLLSSQEILLPLQDPLAQTSLLVQALPSSHAPVLRLLCRQPWIGLHVSPVQTLLSSHGMLVGALPQTPAVHLLAPCHTPALQVASTQTLPSPIAVCLQPPLLSQPSSVQGLLSSQLGPPVPLQVPPAQVSLVLHELPSSQAMVLLTLLQPLAGKHESVVQTLPSSQFALMAPTHAPPLQVSPVVHKLPSSQLAAMLTCLQPTSEAQLSVVQEFLSSQSACWPPAQVPDWQVAPVTHRPPVEHAPVVGVNTQPPLPSQESMVQASPSLQLSVVPRQLPPVHLSPLVHGLPSSQAIVLFVCVQPVPGTHASSVHRLLSSQSAGTQPGPVSLLSVSAEASVPAPASASLPVDASVPAPASASLPVDASEPGAAVSASALSPTSVPVVASVSGPVSVPVVASVPGPASVPARTSVPASVSAMSSALSANSASWLAGLAQALTKTRHQTAGAMRFMVVILLSIREAGLRGQSWTQRTLKLAEIGFVQPPPFVV